MLGRISLFVLILCIHLNAQNEIPKLQIVGIPLPATDELVAVRDENGKYCAAVSIISDLEGLKYQSNNGIVKIDDQPGKDIVYLTADEKVLEVLREGYQPLKIVLKKLGVELEPKRLWSLQITGDDSHLITVNFLVEPFGADIFIDDRPRVRGSTFKLASGRHLIKISKEGYATQWNEIFVNENNALFKFTLRQHDGATIRVETEPEGVMVYLDSLKIGPTPITILKPYDQYQIVLDKDGYLREMDTLDLTNTQDILYKKNLVKSGIITVRTTPAQAVVTINGELVGLTPTKEMHLAYGKHQLKISKKTYKTIIDSFELNDDAKIKNFSLVLDKKVGHLTINGFPGGADVLLNDKKIGALPIADYPLPYEAYDLKIEKPGFHEMKQHFVVDSAQIRFNSVNLAAKSRLKSTIFSVFMPGGGQIYSGKNTRGLLLGTLTFSAIGAAGYSSIIYLDSEDKYLNARERYLSNVNAASMQSLRDNMETKWTQLKDMENIRNAAYGIAGALWLYNVIDALFFFPGGDKVAVSPQINSGETGVSMQISF